MKSTNNQSSEIENHDELVVAREFIASHWTGNNVKVPTREIYEKSIPNYHALSVLLAAMAARYNHELFTKRYFAFYVVENKFSEPSHQVVQETFDGLIESGLLVKKETKLVTSRGRPRDIFEITDAGDRVARRCMEVTAIVTGKFEHAYVNRDSSAKGSAKVPIVNIDPGD